MLIYGHVILAHPFNMIKLNSVLPRNLYKFSEKIIRKIKLHDRHITCIKFHFQSSIYIGEEQIF